MMLLFGNILNAVLDYFLVLGNFGAPKMGAMGSAWATVTSRFLMMLGLGFYIYQWDKKHGQILKKIPFRYERKIFNEMFRMGLPAALQMTFEVGVFALSTTFAARLTTTDLAAHQIVLNIISLTFMVPLGIGSAIAVSVGQALGRKQREFAVRIGWKGFQLGVGFMAASCVFLLLFADLILRGFTNDPQVIMLGKSLLLVAALFQLSDGVQTVGTGALRGIGETRSAMIFNLFGHWVIGLPVGLLLCFRLGWGLKGIWVGLSLGLTVVALAMLARWWVRARAIVAS
jgi:MATE family multidrug resistance protein